MNTFEDVIKSKEFGDMVKSTKYFNNETLKPMVRIEIDTEIYTDLSAEFGTDIVGEAMLKSINNEID